MRVLTIDNKYNDGDRSHFFIERDGVWTAMFKPELTLPQFLEDLLKAINWDEEPCQFDLPDGGAVALVGAAAKSDAEHFFNMLARWDQKEGMLTSFGDWEVGWEELDARVIGQRELSTLRAALLLYQDELMAGNVTEASVEVATDDGAHTALDEFEISDLYEKLN